MHDIINQRDADIIRKIGESDDYYEKTDYDDYRTYRWVQVGPNPLTNKEILHNCHFEIEGKVYRPDYEEIIGVNGRAIKFYFWNGREEFSEMIDCLYNNYAMRNAGDIEPPLNKVSRATSNNLTEEKIEDIRSMEHLEHLDVHITEDGLLDYLEVLDPQLKVTSIRADSLTQSLVNFIQRREIDTFEISRDIETVEPITLYSQGIKLKVRRLVCSPENLLILYPILDIESIRELKMIKYLWNTPAREVVDAILSIPLELLTTERTELKEGLKDREKIETAFHPGSDVKVTHLIAYALRHIEAWPDCEIVTLKYAGKLPKRTSALGKGLKERRLTDATSKVPMKKIHQDNQQVLNNLEELILYPEQDNYVFEMPNYKVGTSVLKRQPIRPTEGTYRIAHNDHAATLVCNCSIGLPAKSARK